MSCTRGDGRLEGLLNEGPEGFRGRKVMRKSNWEYVHTYLWIFTRKSLTVPVEADNITAYPCSPEERKLWTSRMYGP